VDRLSFQNGMNLTAQFFGKRRQVTRLGRVLAAISCIVLLTGVPAQAGPVVINQIIQTLSSSKALPDLQLNLVPQDPGLSGAKGSAPNGGPTNDSALTLGDGSPKLDSLLSGFTLTSDDQKLGVDIVEEGEVEGSVCDCGDILVPGGAFPKWTLLFLTAVPLAFINQCDDCDENPQSTPTPTPPSIPVQTPSPPGVPEPASLLLFGTGLLAAGAGLRRRYTKAKLDGQSEKMGEE
jgi:hypothetical protein